VVGIDTLLVRYIPTWFPGAKFKRDAQSIKPNVRAQFEVPYDMVKEKMVIASNSNSDGKFDGNLKEMRECCTFVHFEPHGVLFKGWSYICPR
jgi:hypothetical protein